MTALGLSADEVLTTTRSVRKRLDLSRRVDRGLIEQCVGIARQAPTPFNRQPWDFVVLTEPEMISDVAEWWRRGLAAVADHSTAAASQPWRTASSEEVRRIAESLDVLAARLHEAPVLLLACARVTNRGDTETIVGQSNIWGAVLPALWSFMLAARERGLGTCWTTVHLPYEQEVADLLGIPFETTVQAALTPVAHTVGTAFKPARRVPTEQFLHWNEW